MSYPTYVNTCLWHEMMEYKEHLSRPTNPQKRVSTANSNRTISKQKLKQTAQHSRISNITTATLLNS